MLHNLHLTSSVGSFKATLYAVSLNVPVKYRKAHNSPVSLYGPHFNYYWKTLGVSEMPFLSAISQFLWPGHILQNPFTAHELKISMTTLCLIAKFSSVKQDLSFFLSRFLGFTFSNGGHKSWTAVYTIRDSINKIKSKVMSGWSW